MPTDASAPAVEVTTRDFKYWAFISYSHRDTPWALWLHNRLENYRVPGDLVGRASRDGPIPRRIMPVFRDRDELSAAHDLGLYISSSLALSRHVIVVCSPRAAASKYVEEEVRYYKSLGREDRVLCLIVDGQPNSADPAQECFPRPVRFRVGPDQAILPQPAQPIAADTRPEGDGRENAFVKIVAGILGVSYDDLVKREKRRRLRRRLQTAALVTVLALAFWSIWNYEEGRRRDQFIAEDRNDAKRDETNGTLRQACLDLVAAGRLMSPAQRADDAWTAEFRHAARALIRPEAELRGDGKRVCYCTFRPDGRRLLTCCWDGSLREWNLDDLPRAVSAPIHTIRENDHDILLCANYSPDGRMIACATWWSALAWISDAKGTLLSRLINDHRGRVNYVAFDHDGRRIVTASDDGTACVWDLRGTRLVSLIGHTAGVKMAVFNPDGTRVLTAGYEGQARVWELAKGTAIETVQDDPDDSLNCADFSPDGRTFVSAGLESRAIVWPATGGGKPVEVFAEHHQRINSAMYSHRGSTILTSSDDGTAKIWNARTGALVASLEGHKGPVLWAAFNGDDTRVATAGKDGTVCLWNLGNLPAGDLTWDAFVARVHDFGLDPADHVVQQNGSIVKR
jgi:hypothetical protein